MALVKIDGIDAVRRMLNDIAPTEARKLMRQTVQDIAKQVVDDAKARMPRDSGAMISGTYAKQEKMEGVSVSSTVRVRRAFYWRFLEYGDGPDHVEHAMFLQAKEHVMSTIDHRFLDAFSKRLITRLMKG